MIIDIFYMTPTTVLNYPLKKKNSSNILELDLLMVMILIIMMVVVVLINGRLSMMLMMMRV